MTEKQILRKIEKVLDLLMEKDIKNAIKILLELKYRLEEEIKKKEKGEGKKLQHIMGWYLSIWDNQPPESYRFKDYRFIIGKHLKELCEIYERNGEDIEALKRDYENFKQSRQDFNGILQFRMNLPSLKKKKGKEWSSPENQRGKEYYLQGLWGGDDDEIPWAK